MHRVLGIPELLDMIFSFVDEASNASNARVCKQWSEIALDTLWRNVDNLYRLFGLLAPLRATSDGSYEFARIPETSDWRRFERYSRRVRELHFDASDAAYPLQQCVFDDVARTRITLNILPSMHTLDWNASPPLSVMFMHANIKRLVLHLPGATLTSHPRPYFQDVVARMPNITHLDLRTHIRMSSFEDDAAELLQGLTKLQKLILPRFHLTTKVAEALSRLKHLGVIEFEYNEGQGHGDPLDTHVFRPSLKEGAFPALWDLSMAAGFADAAHFIDMPFAPVNLTMLYIDSYALESPADIQSTLEVVSENCRLLKYLALVSFLDPATAVELPPDEDRVNMETLKPLLNCPNLVSLELLHQYPLHLRQEDIEELASKWPSLETLVLNNEPAYLDQSTLTLQALLPFSQHCPRLRHLGLFIEATTPNLPSLPPLSETPSPPQYAPFQRLTRLSMGVSVISDEGAAALFLSQICPLQCHLDSGVTWENDVAVDVGTSEKIRGRCEKWDKVGELLPLLIRLRIEEKARTRLLQSEVEDLRMRTGVLMDNAAMKRRGILGML